MAAEVEFVKERIFKPDRENLKSLIAKDETIRLFVYAVFIACIISSVFMIINPSPTLNFVSKVTAASSVMLVLTIYIGRDKVRKAKNENITENKPGKNYLINIGYEVKTLYGSALKSFRAANNIVRPLLLCAEQFKRHMLIMATIGAGKSVFMKGMIEQHVLNDGGGLCVDGKGTAEFAKEIYALFVAIGREDDFIHINFLDMDHTHTINPLLSGSAEALYEILIALLEGEENEWKAKQKGFMKNILKLLVWQRDNENLKLDFSELSRLIPFAAVVESAILYRDKVYLSNALDDFVSYISTALSMQFEKFLKADPEEIRKRMQEALSNGEQGAYDAGMAAQAWIDIITSLKSDYGRVFNTQTPTISMWEAVQKNKFIFVTLPTMASDTTPKQLGKLILGLIKGVAAEKAEKAVGPKIPFICWFDEIGSYIIEGFGRLMSKSRALGISIIPIFQSPAQIDSVGKIVGSESLERREIFDTTGTHILMKNIHPETTELYNKMIKQNRFIDMDYADKRESVKGQIGAEDHYRVEKEDAIKHEEVIGMNNGEMMVFNDGKMYRATATTESSLAKYGKKISFELKLMNSPIPITQYIPKKQFLMDAYRLYKKLGLDEEKRKAA